MSQEKNRKQVTLWNGMMSLLLTDLNHLNTSVLTAELAYIYNSTDFLFQ